MIQKSGSKIPSEWIERIEQEGDKNKTDYTAIDEFIIMYYDKKTITSIANICGVSWGCIKRRVHKLKKSGRLNG